MHQSPATKNPELSAALPDDVVLSVRNVSKKFCRNLRRSMGYGIKDLVCNLMGARQDTTGLRKDEFWALNNIAFDLKKGEILGLIGRNGSGKTTLLRILTGIFPPDKGVVEFKGRMTSLIALGAGFHPHMTGRENIFLNGTILGMTSKEIHAKYDDIVSFSEVGDFIDAPVATYSSGMRVRLGFSVAVHLAPQLLLIDEVLSVGDNAFKCKSEAKIRELLRSGVSVLFVSHNLSQVTRLCNRVIHLDTGVLRAIGPANEVISAYLEESEPAHDFGESASTLITRHAIARRPHIIEVRTVTIAAGGKSSPEIVRPFDDIAVSVVCVAKTPLDGVVLDLWMETRDGVLLTWACSEGIPFTLDVGSRTITCTFRRVPVRSARCSLGLMIRSKSELLFESPMVASFRVGVDSDRSKDKLKRDLLAIEPEWR